MSKFRMAGSSIDLDPEWIAKMSPVLKGEAVGLYGRISGQKSLDGSSLESQIAVTRRFALACGAHIAAERTEVITGVFITSRSQFNELLQRAEKGEIKFIIVDVRDRLGRGDAISVLEFLARQAGAQIVYASQPADLDTYEGAALDATETLVSRIERLNIRRRTNRGRREWSSEGRIFTGRFFPYGYRLKIERDDKGRLIERTLVIHPPEAEAVRRIFHWFVVEDLTTYAIAIRLQQLGVPVPEGHQCNRKLTENQWYSSTINRILENETYAGVWHYAKRIMQKYEAGKQIRYKVGVHPKEHRIAVEVPVIVDRTLWQAAQDTLKRHAHGGRSSTHEYVLGGLVRCTHSNTNMHGQTTVRRENEYGYYVCPHTSPHLRLEIASRCDVKRLPRERLEGWAWKTLMKLGEEPEQIRQEMALRREEAASRNVLVQQAIEGLEREINRLKRQKSDLLDLYLNRDRSAEGLSRDDYETKARQINAQVAELDAQIARRQGEMKPDAYTPDEAEEAIRLLEDLRLVGTEATFEDKRVLLRLLNVQVLYDGRLIQLAGSVPVCKIRLARLLRASRDSSSPPLQSEPGVDSPQAEGGSSTFVDRKRSTDCTRG